MALIKRKEQVSYDFNPLNEGTPVMSFAHEQQATEYVNKLVKGDFPPEAIAIRATDLFFIEKVIGPTNYSKVALRGLKQGLYYAGGFFAACGFFSGYTWDTVQLSLLVGGGYGAVMLLIEIFGAMKDAKKQNFESTVDYMANKYEVIVNPELEDQVQDAFLKGALGAKQLA